VCCGVVGSELLNITMLTTIFPSPLLLYHPPTRCTRADRATRRERRPIREPTGEWPPTQPPSLCTMHPFSQLGRPSHTCPASTGGGQRAPPLPLNHTPAPPNRSITPGKDSIAPLAPSLAVWGCTCGLGHQPPPTSPPPHLAHMRLLWPLLQAFGGKGWGIWCDRARVPTRVRVDRAGGRVVLVTLQWCAVLLLGTR
jgi:hypothetical protein